LAGFAIRLLADAHFDQSFSTAFTEGGGFSLAGMRPKQRLPRRSAPRNDGIYRR